MNMNSTHFAAVILMFSVGCAAAGQNGLQGVSEQEPEGHVGTSKAQDPGLTLYEDTKDGFQFKYPSYLYQDYAPYVLSNRPDNDFIRVGVSLSSIDPKPDPNLGQAVSTETHMFNHLKWVDYVSQKGNRHCTSWNHEQVCFTVSALREGKQLSSRILGAMQVIESTFVCSLSDRMDSKIATVRVGDRFGSLKVSRVVTREMAERNPKKYGDGYFGKIDFTGSLALTGSMEDFRTMNSGPDWVFSCDGQSCSLLPFGLGEDTLTRVEFTRWSKLADRQMTKASPQFGSLEVTIVVKNLSVTSGPGGGQSYANADLVSMIVNR